MTDEPPKTGVVRQPRQLEKRLLRIKERFEPDAARRAQINLIFDVLDAIATDSAPEPARLASAILNGVARAELVGKQPPQTFEKCRELLMSAAEKAALTLSINEPALGYLFKKSRTGLPRQEWESAVRTATAILGATRALRHTLEWVSLMDTQGADEAFGKLAAATSGSKGVLLLTYHGANVVPAQQLLKVGFEGAALLRRNHLEIGDRKKFRNARDMMFGALRLLQEGGMVLMAPDGPSGRQSVKLEIFEGATLAGDGAGFLAHASGSNTAWYTAVRRDDRFAPVVEFGPVPESGESLVSFSGRLNRFYAQKLEESLSGDPRDIALSANWAHRLLTIAGDAIAPSQEPGNGSHSPQSIVQ